MTSEPKEYVLARRILLDALDALTAHRPSLVFVGAQVHRPGECRTG